MNYRFFLLFLISANAIFCPWRSEGLTYQEQLHLAILTERRAAQVIKEMRARLRLRSNSYLTVKQLAEEARVCRARSAQNRVFTAQYQANSVARLSIPKKLVK
jgi:hypothetical protein